VEVEEKAALHTLKLGDEYWHSSSSSMARQPCVGPGITDNIIKEDYQTVIQLNGNNSDSERD
jgi:hypothetical protein